MMEETTKKGEFISIDFIARIKGSDKIFDLTDADVAKKEGIYQENKEYKPLIVCLGAGHLLKGLDRALTDAEIKKQLEVEVLPEDAFGKRNSKLIKLTNIKQFKDKGVTPVPGLQLGIDGALATIRSVSGGRVIIDFNHPLAGRTLLYDVKIIKKITDTKEKIAGLIHLLTELNESDYSLDVTDKEIKVDIKKDMPKDVLETVKKQITKFIPESKKKEIKITTKTK